MGVYSLLALVLIVLLNLIVLLAICWIGIKTKKICVLDVIGMKQYFVSMLSTVIISFLLPTSVAALLFIVLFFVYRNVVFKKYALTVQQIYKAYNGEACLCKPIQNFSEIFASDKIPDTKEKLNEEYSYSFSKYLNNSIYIFVFYCAKDFVRPESTILYGIEFFIAITALCIVVGKLTYNLAWSTHGLFYLSPTLAYIPAVFCVVMIYVVAVLMFMNTL